MYYGPNYDTTSTSVVPPVSVSPDVSSPVSPSPDQPSDEEWESDEPHDGDDDDNDDWITPGNLHRAREQMGGATTVSAKNVTVGCLTTDFSMQVVCPSVTVYTYIKSFSLGSPYYFFLLQQSTKFLAL